MRIIAEVYRTAAHGTDIALPVIGIFDGSFRIQERMPAEINLIGFIAVIELKCIETIASPGIVQP